MEDYNSTTSALSVHTFFGGGIDLWNGLNEPIGTEMIIEQLRQFLLTTDKSNKKF
ncbi:hypothetical protein [Nodularia sp. UHCC 0506]|uniref:hypothetical protein n=1 Tax=Nodularia sp. UHCC 0506 TaxID=3110243 RepID=UPI002B20E05A|nr:hypothetical protein [Nodularia sp. UHCC 0506]MEA5515409.1 hypothetical protein [Nodularia sp. UHCC 0506]